MGDRPEPSCLRVYLGFEVRMPSSLPTPPQISQRTDRSTSMLSSARIKPAALILGAILLINLVSGWLLAGDYGESWDERRRFRYGVQSLQAYTGQDAIEDEIDQEAKGPAYVMLAVGLSGLFENLRPAWERMQAFHFVHFAFHQLGLIFLYLICRRMMSRPAALGVVLIYTTQPLLWGHAFINPKDTPFMTAFLGAVAAGMWMADAFQTRYFKGSPDPFEIDENAGERLQAGWYADWRAAGAKKKSVFFFVGSASIILAFANTLGTRYVRSGLTSLVEWAYTSGADGFPGTLIRRYAPHWGIAPVEGYIERVLSVYPGAAIGLFVGALILFTLNLVWFSPHWSELVWHLKLRPILKIQSWLSILRSGASKPEVYIGAAVLGFCSAVRILGPAAGILVGLYFILRSGRRSLPVLVIYTIAAVAVLFILWPGLWPAPIETLWSNLTSAADFPWSSKVRFNGYDYFPDDLPAAYFPKLLALQLTEPTLGLILLGLVVSARWIKRNPELGPSMAVNLAWFGVPFLAIITLRPTMYDNFRHFLFITPPLFIFSGIGLEAIWKGVWKLFQSTPSDWWKNGLAALIILAAVLPGIVSIVRLHPYQYVYYNSLTGGVQGAFRWYELDYWATSYRETTERLNEIALAEAHIVAEAPTQIISTYARPDLTVTRLIKGETDDPNLFDYAILPTRNDKDLKFFTQAKTEFRVGYKDAVFVVVKRLSDTSDGQ